ncbi:histidine kinase [Pararhizobium polonicum]|uniref:histidine kinase n=1 Tax=Pararhizobium polonicum TaxID=1612624 RepID=A0A1C7P2W5_9HYPH|nr:HAMP domain-containing sensor histidine kinase [Pararhizobium polonicum]OBZ95623.1 histidine kinase [Pararhizobium polonicum]
MLRVKLWRSTPFRLAVTFGSMFILAFLMSGFMTYQFLKRELLGSLDRTVSEVYTVVASTYATNDLEDVIGAVDTYARLNGSEERVFSVMDASGKRLAGNVTVPALPFGLSTVEARDIGLQGDARYRVIAGKVGDQVLTVGQSFAETDDLEDIARASFGWSSLLVVVIAVAGGLIVASRAQKRLDRIAQAMNAVSLGNLDVRVPLKGNGDDIDAVSGQINQALERLSVLVETMRQVSSDIAHELKTPLNRLKMIIEDAVSRDDLPEDTSSLLLDAKNESDQINATFEALLRISQIEAGARRVRFSIVDLKDMMHAVQEIYADVADDNGMVLDADFVNVSGPVLGDRELLTQMFVNLVENAINHCPRGTRISLLLTVKANQVTAAVSDNGPGIPADERDKVFRRLYRLDKSRTTPGSGLGLSLVRAIVDLHGGHVVIDDNHPGVAVKITIPIVQA